ncbi:MAG: TatD family hydrolase [Nitrospira sp.]|nr:TatD family hydrolase [Nitrospira sp.]HBP88902.1 hydrolase TatD [Nitrospiraceae bacterium]HNP31190.1 TatD family hydrolase [Nitrospirales bacterium]
MLIDTHVHLDDPRYDPDREDMLQRAHEAGVEKFVTIGCDLSTSYAAVQLATTRPNVFATIGVHPHEVNRIEPKWFTELSQLASQPKVVAFGEIGLDYHYDHSPREIQRQRFREQIALAKALTLPLVIHTREAREDTMAILQEEHAETTGGVFHCFSEDLAFAKRALDLGFYLSFSGIITFRNASQLREVVRAVPDDRLLIETDAPYLTPIPFRGKRNESAYIAYVAEQIAEIKYGDSKSGLARVAELTTKNACQLFKISS